MLPAMGPGVLVLLAVAAILAACGGSGEGASAGARQGGVATAAQGRAPVARDPWTHLRGLASIAARNGGDRAAGSPGGAATERFIAERLVAAGWGVRFERVTFPFFAERRAPRLTLPGGRRLRHGSDVRTLAFSPGGSVRARVKRVGGSRADAGCRAADWRSFPRGRIALVRRGTCRFATKARRAQAAGAAAVVISEPASSVPPRATLGAPGLRVPVVAVDAQAGTALARASGAVALSVDAVSERRAVRNVIGELPGTAGDRVVMAGAHLDSVAAGPGMNDNGSGVSALLAIAGRLSVGSRPRDTVRLAFWQAEELGLYGSRRHVAGLAPAERARLRAYLNLDMVGSPNGAPSTYGRGEAEAALRQALDDVGPRPLRTSLGGASDHAPFARAGVEVGGVFTGADERVSRGAARRFGLRAKRPADACYHRACDRLANIDRRLLSRVTAATLAALRALAG
jgi:hypothetical protein